VTRGRQSTDQRKPRTSKPRPPAHLTDTERDIWARVCAGQDGAWCDIAASGALLEMYCVALAHYRLLVAARQVIMADKDVSADEKLKSTARLSDGITMQAGHVATLETKLRLTPQSRQRSDSKPGSPVMPWDVHPEDDGDTA
jgi:phage terminase small subunit